MGFWRLGNWVWDCRWRRDCTGRVGEEEKRLMEVINEFKIKKDKVDSWRWVYSSDSSYSVKAAYDFLSP
ncbi:hypothetical protein SLA2020_398490 [Shorea laevis]